MKLSVKPIGVAVLLLLALSACSSKEDDENEPTLPEITNKVEPQEVWSSSVGNGIKHYDVQLKPAIFDNKVYAASRDGEVTAANARANYLNNEALQFQTYQQKRGWWVFASNYLLVTGSDRQSMSSLVSQAAD